MSKKNLTREQEKAMFAGQGQGKIYRKDYADSEINKGDMVEIIEGTYKGRVVKVVGFDNIKGTDYVLVDDKRWKSPRAFEERYLKKTKQTSEKWKAIPIKQYGDNPNKTSLQEHYVKQTKLGEKHAYIYHREDKYEVQEGYIKDGRFQKTKTTVMEDSYDNWRVIMNKYNKRR